MKTHEINLKIQDESELYLTLDPYQNTLSQEIVDYLTRVTLNMHGKSNGVWSQYGTEKWLSVIQIPIA